MTQTPSSRLGRRRELLQTDRRGEAGRPGPDDDHVILHPLAFDVRHAPATGSPLRTSRRYGIAGL